MHICLALEIRNVVNYIKNTFLLKTGYETMRNYKKTFQCNDKYNVVHNVLYKCDIAKALFIYTYMYIYNIYIDRQIIDRQINLSIYPSIYLSIYLSFYMYIYIYLYIYIYMTYFHQFHNNFKRQYFLIYGGSWPWFLDHLGSWVLKGPES